MSHLRLFDPDQLVAGPDESHDSPQILPLDRFASTASQRQSVTADRDGAAAVHSSPPVLLGLHGADPAESHTRRLVRRAALLRENSVCPHCRRTNVIPLELNDALIGRGNLPIPGSATLVGFHCHSCHSEWPATDHRVQ